jgi:hypothetical protein
VKPLPEHAELVPGRVGHHLEPLALDDLWLSEPNAAELRQPPDQLFRLVDVEIEMCAVLSSLRLRHSPQDQRRAVMVGRTDGSSSASP